MNLPFTIDQFLDVFRRYNEMVWPIQWVLNLLAIAAVIAAIKGDRRASNAAVGILAFLWIWTGVVYHLAFFRTINPASTFFGALFVVEGLLIGWLGIGRDWLKFERRLDLASVTGFVLLVYALIAYPLIGFALGHRYPAAPTFGVPCPTTIFTFGIMLLATPPRSRTLLVIPVAWSLLGLSAALQLGMWEDIGLVIAAAIATLFAFFQRPAEHPGEVVFARP